jgi:hypothetical protein
MKSHADLMCGVMASMKCRASAAWLQQEGEGEIPSGQVAG